MSGDSTSIPELFYDSNHPAIAGAYHTPQMDTQLDTQLDQLKEALLGNDIQALNKLFDDGVNERIVLKLTETIGIIVSIVREAKNPRFMADIISLACGLSLREGIAPADIARKYGFSRTHVCEQIRIFCDEYGIPCQITLDVETKDLGKTHSDTNKRNENLE